MATSTPNEITVLVVDDEEDVVPAGLRGGGNEQQTECERGDEGSDHPKA